MPEENTQLGALAIVLLALHDRDFYIRLLESPRTAIPDALTITPDELEKLTAMIEGAEQRLGRGSLMAMWERYAATIEWTPGEWQDPDPIHAPYFPWLDEPPMPPWHRGPHGPGDRTGS